MGTRGLVGFRVDETDFLSYQQFDSYPSGVGQQVLDELKELLYGGDTLVPLKDQVRAIRLVKSEEEPTEEEQQKYMQYWENVSTGKDWYSFLRECQGHIALWLKAGIMIDSQSFIKDSLFCEWAYIVNLDTMKLEVYKGFQTTPTKNGRYKARKSSSWKPKYDGDNFYYPCELIAEFEFTNLPDKMDEALFPVLKELYPENYNDIL
jgi:hypothetical protein